MVTDGGSGRSIDYLVIAGGGAGGCYAFGGGGGAGGYRSSFLSETSGGGGASEDALSLGTGTYTVTIGAGGAGVTYPNTSNQGSNSVFNQTTSVGGGDGIDDEDNLEQHVEQHE